MKKKVFRERNWQEIIDAAAKADDEVKYGKKVKIERVGKIVTNTKVKEANVTEIDENIPYTLTNKKKVGK